MHVHRHLSEAWFYHLSQDNQFVERSNLENLLAEIISKLIKHQVCEERCYTLYQCRLEGFILRLCQIILEPLLKHAAALLVVTKELDLP
jgi:hypothetical protein